MQSRDAILRNYPLIGHMRYVFSSLGEFFRQYFFAMDREELPFNRAERNWIESASKNCDSTVAFGSTKYIKEAGTPIFVNCPYPTLEKDIEPTPPFIIGRDTPNPYEPQSFFNISGMSFGALSAPAVLALSKGAKMAGCWLNTGEGGLSPHHLAGGADIVFQIGTAKYGVRNADGSLNEAKLRDIAAIAANENVRDQAFARRQARQGRHSPWREGHPGNRGDPGNSGRRGFDQPQSSP